MSAPGSASRPTIYDVARRAHVSKSLVSLVMQGSPNVSDKRRAAVLLAIDELGYTPSRAAATLAGSRSRAIGVVIDDYRNMWFVDLLDGLRSVLDARGYTVTVSDRHPAGGVGLDAVSGFLSMNVEGLVIATEPEGLPLARVTVPMVVAGGRQTSPDAADVVANDDARGVALAMGHLLGLGHTRIGHLSGEGGSAGRRRAEFESQMGARGFAAPVFGTGRPTTEDEGYRDTHELLNACPDTTAIFAANDTMAFGALAALREKGLRVPADISLVGYDNSPLAASKYVDLTTIDAQSDAVGAEAARALLARIADPGIGPKMTLISPKLVERTSAAAPSPGSAAGRM